MKLYGTMIGEKEYNVLKNECGLKPGWCNGDLERVVRIDEPYKYHHYVCFRRKLDATKFALWVAGWIPAHLKDGRIPIVELPIQM